MTVYRVPLSAKAQSFTVSLGGVPYRIDMKWNTSAGVWVIDIFDTEENVIVSGIPLVTGCDMLEQFGYLGIGGRLYAQTDNEPLLPPNYDGIGKTANLYFVTED